MAYANFGPELQRLLEKYDVKQYWVAKKIGVDPSVLSQVLTGKRNRKLSDVKIKGLSDVLSSRIPRGELEALLAPAPRKQARPGALTSYLSEPTLQLIAHELSNREWSREERKGLNADLEYLVLLWDRYREAKKELHRSLLPDSEQSHKAVLDDLSLHQPQLRMFTLLDLARVFYYRAEKPRALEYLQQALSIAEQLEQLEVKWQILETFGNVHRRAGDWAKAHSYYDQARIIAQELKDDRLEAICLRKQAGTYIFQGELDKGLGFAEQSLELSKKLDDPEGIYKAEQHIAWSQSLRGRFDEAIRLHEKVITDAEKLAYVSDRELAKAHSYLAEVHRMADRLDEAKKEFEKALDLIKKQFKGREEEEKFLRAAIFIGLGDVYLHQGNIVEAGRKLLAGLELSRDIDDRFRIALAYRRLGRLALKQKEYPKAQEHFQQAQNIFDNEAADTYNSVAVKIDRAILAYERGDWDESIEVAAQALVKAKESKFTHLVARVRMLQADDLLRSGDIAGGVDLYGEVSQLVPQEQYLIAQVLERIESRAKFWDSKQPGAASRFYKAVHKQAKKNDPKRQQIVIWHWLAQHVEETRSDKQYPRSQGLGRPSKPLAKRNG